MLKGKKSLHHFGVLLRFIVSGLGPGLVSCGGGWRGRGVFVLCGSERSDGRRGAEV